MNRRLIEKIREEIKRRISEILQYETRDPRLELITVMDVRLSQDLRQARIYVGVTGLKTSEEEALALLRQHRGFFRSELAKRLELRHTPELIFEIDPIEKQARRIEELLEKTDD